jgi:hypothetical protein
MDDMDDLPLDVTPPPAEPERDEAPLWPWVAGLLIVAGVVASIVYFRSTVTPPASKPVETRAASVPPADPHVAPLGPAVEPVALPPLDSSDAAVRELIKAVSSRPEVLAWLATDGLLRQIALCIENVADGKSPAKVLKVLAPVEPFRATAVNGRDAADAASFRRYDGMAGAVGALDMNGVARLYSMLKPRLDEAFQQLGHKPGDIDAGVERALTHLLDVPAVAADTPLRRVVLSYHYVDDNIEGLSGAQKQLLRMGPRNAQTVLAKLRELAAALGVRYPVQG